LSRREKGWAGGAKRDCRAAGFRFSTRLGDGGEKNFFRGGGGPIGAGGDEPAGE